MLKSEFGELCYCIEEKRRKIKGLPSKNDYWEHTNEYRKYPIYEVESKYKTTNHQAEYLIELNIHDFFEVSSNQTLMDRFLTTNTYRRREHKTYTSNNSWKYFTKKWDYLMKKHGFGYELLFLCEKTGRKSVYSESYILMHNDICIPLSPKEPISFTVQGINIFGNVYIHVWLDIEEWRDYTTLSLHTIS